MSLMASCHAAGEARLSEPDPAGVALLERYAEWLTELSVATEESTATEP